ncbi:hypothetical protein WUBG_08876 [Wuchereria bancrofti]|uniref:ATPase family AAA domain-containing protein n=1 Tax=Wuchereria bancrofti TaxID=6293 RepID=J9ESZ6_WUCBA|nr:hypothetical protein WUBG_08876 [Wuchereria bancrofti]
MPSFFDILGLGSQEGSSKNISQTTTGATSGELQCLDYVLLFLLDSSGNASKGSNTGAQTQMQKGYSFDSSALERAADAARQLEMSRNAKEAFEMARLQEFTKIIITMWYGCCNFANCSFFI